MAISLEVKKFVNTEYVGKFAEIELSYQTPLAHMTHLTDKAYVIKAVLIPFGRIFCFSQGKYRLSCKAKAAAL